MIGNTARKRIRQYEKATRMRARTKPHGGIADLRRLLWRGTGVGTWVMG